MLCLTLAAQAGSLPHVADLANTFTAEQEAALQKRMEHIWDIYQFDTLIATTRDSRGYSAKAYAAEFFEEFREDFRSYPNGLTFSFNFDLGEYFNSTRGLASSIFPQGDNSALESVLRSAFKSKDYYTGMHAFLDYVERMLSRHSRTDSTGKVILTGERRNPGLMESAREVAAPLVPFIGIFGLLIGIGYAFYAKGKLLIAAPQTDASSYLQRGAPDFRDASETFLYQTVIRTKLPESNTRSGGRMGGGGGSYTSSSGGSYGGSGGKL